MRTTGSHKRPPSRFRAIRTFAAFALFGALLFFLGRLSAPGAPVAEAPAASPPSEEGSGPQPAAARPRPATLPVLVRPTPEVPEKCEGPSDQARKEMATMVTDRLFERIGGISRMPGMEDPESRANMLREYARGLADAMRMARSDLINPLAQDFNDRLCRGAMPADQTILFSYFAQELPEIVGKQGLECFFNRAKGKEDVALWSMMDAWRGSGGDKPAALAALEASATDKRTLWRAMPREQAEAARMAASNGEASPFLGPVVQGTPRATPTPPASSGSAPVNN